MKRRIWRVYWEDNHNIINEKSRFGFDLVQKKWRTNSVVIVLVLVQKIMIPFLQNTALPWLFLKWRKRWSRHIICHNQEKQKCPSSVISGHGRNSIGDARTRSICLAFSRGGEGLHHLRCKHSVNKDEIDAEPMQVIDYILSKKLSLTLWIRMNAALRWVWQHLGAVSKPWILCNFPVSFQRPTCHRAASHYSAPLCAPLR